MKPAQLFVAASASYAANALLGVAVAARLLDTSGYRWFHHALYVLTVVLTATALSTAVMSKGTRHQVAAVAPVLVPLALMPSTSPRSRGHVVIALTAAPFLVAGVLIRGS